MPIAVLPDTLHRSDAASAARRGFGRLATFAAVYTYALIAVGGIVRITGSGLGCGDDWPRCHGQWIPPFTFETVIEYAHRLLAAGISFVVLAVVVQALRRRRMPGFSGRGGLLRPALLAGVFLVVQVLLGGVTVMLKLPAAVTILHLGTAMALLATLLVAAIRAGALGGRGAGETAVGAEGARKVARSALGAAALGYLVVLMGALVANTGAPVTGAPSGPPPARPGGARGEGG
ncbi:MAG: COX15/CtaA family protein, partial [Gemmatimonadetes bacterium]|nr:COX15/CtaA family protein [Gemmatimonadota bacterium]